MQGKKYSTEFVNTVGRDYVNGYSTDYGREWYTNVQICKKYNISAFAMRTMLIKNPDWKVKKRENVKHRDLLKSGTDDVPLTLFDRAKILNNSLLNKLEELADDENNTARSYKDIADTLRTVLNTEKIIKEIDKSDTTSEYMDMDQMSDAELEQMLKAQP